jgi:hypothetical protein
METPNMAALTAHFENLGVDEKGVDRVLRTFNVRRFEEARSG